MKTISEIVNMQGNSGVDIDDITISFLPHMITQINKEFYPRTGRMLTYNDVVQYSIWELSFIRSAGISEHDIIGALKALESKKTIEYIMPSLGCMESLNTLHDQGKIYFVTSRSKRFYNDPQGMTERWLKNVEKLYNFKPDGVQYNHKKHETIEEYNLVKFFEDNPYNSVEIMREDVPVILFNMPANKLNHWDKELLAPEQYKEKRELIRELESYSGNLLFRVSGWGEVRNALRNRN